MKQDHRTHYTRAVTKITTQDCMDLIILAMEEDAPNGDVTSEAIFNTNAKGRGQIVANEEGILCGESIIACLFDYNERQKNEQIDYKFLFKDGQKFQKGDSIVQFSGSLLALLRLERTILNFLQYLSGISSKVHQFVSKFGPEVTILDTRKTLPAYRRLAKYAVYCGGGTNHRIHLSDMAMIKDNHIAAAGGNITRIVEAIRKKQPELRLELEIDNIFSLEEALCLDVDVILLDNMTTENIHKAVNLIRKNNLKAKNKKTRITQPFIELSGNLTEDNLKKWREFGCTAKEIGMSMGAITHTTRFLDLSMEIAPMAYKI